MYPILAASQHEALQPRRSEIRRQGDRTAVEPPDLPTDGPFTRGKSPTFPRSTGRASFTGGGARSLNIHERTNLTNFSALGLPETLLRALTTKAQTPTSIQTQAIPHLLEGRDLLGIAQTGTGKTAAFALPILARLIADRRRPAPFTARVLVLAPTRELAAQIGESFRAYGRFLRPALSLAVVVGGVSARPQVDHLARGLDVLVATPGRLLDHMGRAS